MLLARALLLLASSPLVAHSPGTFQGKIVEGPKSDSKQYIYVRVRGASVRLVNIEEAHIRYAKAVPAARMPKQPGECLIDGVEVQITAEQQADGEWRAKDILILSLPAAKVIGNRELL